MEKTQTFQITDITAFQEKLSRLGEHNPEFDLTKRELAQKGLVGERIYETLFPCEDVALVPGRYTKTLPETASSSSANCNAAEEIPTEEEGSKDSLPQEAEDECLLVQVCGESVGYIRKANYAHLKELLTGGMIVSLSLELHGGRYRMLFEDGELEEGDAGWFGLLTAEVKEPQAEKNTAPESGTMHYISTSYDTVLLDERGRRGNGALVLALMLGAFYLGFSIPYWIMVRRGIITASTLLGGDLPNNLLNPHLALVIAAVVCTLTALLMKNSIVPMAAAALFAGSAWTLPGYALFTTLSAVLCMTAALRKKSKRALTFVKVLLLLGVIGLCGWFLKDTALYFWNNKSFMIRPTGQEEAQIVPDVMDSSDFDSIIPGEDGDGGTFIDDADDENF